MPYPDRMQLSPSAQHVAREYERARKMGITQKEFAEATGLSSARYLRKILAGERSGTVIERRAEQGGVFNVPMVNSSGDVVSKNVRLPPGTSRLDIFRPKTQKAMRAGLKDTSQAYQKRYESTSQYRFQPKGIRHVPEAQVRRMPVLVRVR